MDKIKNLGQVYTPQHIVDFMISLIKNKGNVLETSSGDGAFSKIKDILSIEIDPDNDNGNNIIMDFFDYSIDNKFDTVIGNPPYVAFKHINKDTLDKIQNLEYFVCSINTYKLYQSMSLQSL